MTDMCSWLDPTAEILGASLRVMVAAFQLPQQAQKLLVKHGLPADPQPTEWYPLRAWLRVLRDLEKHYGPQTVYAAGLQVVNHSLWPPTSPTLLAVLHGLDQAHRTNVRGTRVGYYRVEERGPRELRLECLTPVSAEFDRGIITGVARKFRPAGAVRVHVVLEPFQAQGPPDLKRFRVWW